MLQFIRGKTKKEFRMINNHKKEFKMINNHKMIKREKGVTLLEVLAVVIIGILIVVGAFTLYGSAQDKQRESDVMTSLLTLQTNVRDLFYGVNDYSGGEEGDLNSVIIASGGAPSTFVKGSGDTRELVSPFDTTQPVTITGEGSEFSIAIAGVPQSSCVSLATRNGSFLRVKVGGKEVTSAADAADQCSAGSNTVTYFSN